MRETNEMQVGSFKRCNVMQHCNDDKLWTIWKTSEKMWKTSGNNKCSYEIILTGHYNEENAAQKALGDAT